MGKHQVKRRNLKKLKAFGNHLKEIRVAKNMTQEQLADKASVSEYTIVTLESGKLNTSLPTCFAIAKALGISPLDLFDF